MSLADLKPGQTAVVTALQETDLGVQRLITLGLVEGCRLSLVRRAIGGDPLEIEVRGAALTLRGSEAAKIQVQLEEPA